MRSARFRFLSLIGLAILTVALVAACGDDDNGDEDMAPVDPTPENGAPAPATGLEGESAQTLSITMTDIAFSDEALAIGAGELVEIALANDGALEHDFTIDSIPVEFEVGGDAAANGDADLHVDVPDGGSGTVRLIVSEPGEYEFYCSVPGHREAGMEGTLTVE